MIRQLKAVGKRDGRNKQRGRRQQRQRDGTEGLPSRSAVNGRCLQQVHIDALQAGKEEHHQVSGFPPYIHHRHGRKHGFLMGQHVHRLHAQRYQHLVKQAVAGHVDKHPHAGNGDHRHNGGVKISRADKADMPAAPVDQQRQKKTDHHTGDHRI